MAKEKGTFRADLYYRLNTMPIFIPPLRERKDDIKLLFRKFTTDIAEKYKMPPLQLNPEALVMLENYRWEGNIRQLKNVTEQISILEKERMITPDILKRYLPEDKTSLPILYKNNTADDVISDRDLLYKVLFDMRKDIMELRATVRELSENKINTPSSDSSLTTQHITPITTMLPHDDLSTPEDYFSDQDIEVEFLQDKQDLESLSLEDKEKEIIKKALIKYKGKRKDAAKELGISERTLYRKINEYDIKL